LCPTPSLEYFPLSLSERTSWPEHLAMSENGKRRKNVKMDEKKSNLEWQIMNRNVE
jgi:hypothetical protein